MLAKRMQLWKATHAVLSVNRTFTQVSAATDRRRRYVVAPEQRPMT